MHDYPEGIALEHFGHGSPAAIVRNHNNLQPLHHGSIDMSDVIIIFVSAAD